MGDRPLRLPPNRLMVKLYHTPLAPIQGRMFLMLTTRGSRGLLPAPSPGHPRPGTLGRVGLTGRQGRWHRRLATTRERRTCLRFRRQPATHD